MVIVWFALQEKKFLDSISISPSCGFPLVAMASSRILALTGYQTVWREDRGPGQLNSETPLSPWEERVAWTMKFKKSGEMSESTKRGSQLGAFLSFTCQHIHSWVSKSCSSDRMWHEKRVTGRDNFSQLHVSHTHTRTHFCSLQFAAQHMCSEQIKDCGQLL